MVKDHMGNEFNSEKEMCEHWGIPHKLFQVRTKNQLMSVADALMTNVPEAKSSLSEHNLEIDCPEIAAEWHPTKNGDLRPCDVKRGSHQKVWWVAKCSHEWQATVLDRSRGRSCPYCSGHAALAGYNDLATTHPELASEWHPAKNGDLKPCGVARCSRRKVWWLGECGHEWEATVHNRSINSSSCPYCSGKAVLAGYNDLATTHPELASEWHPAKNGNLAPEMISYGSHKKVWWLGKCGHEWQATVNDRAGKDKTGCPVCSKEGQSSFPEQAIFYYIKQAFSDAINGDRKAIGMELDIYIPSVKIAIEYDGAAWHGMEGGDKREVDKNAACIINGIYLIRVREEGLQLYNADECECITVKTCANDDELTWMIQEVMLSVTNISSIEFSVDVNVQRDRIEIMNQYITQKKNNSLAKMCPDIAKEWHPNKNGDLTPEMVTAGSVKEVWWLGKCGHEWQKTIYSRSARRTGCPICSGYKVEIGVNDLESCFPDIAKEWHPYKNEALLPSDITKSSTKKVWWLCSKCGHEWQTAVRERTGHDKTGCPNCYNQRRGKKSVTQW